jgi:ankyrin repeat protein
MHELSQKQTCSEVLEALELLPSGLHAIYSRMLLRIPAERRSASQAILRWVTMTARPLQLQELAGAVGILVVSPPMTVDRATRDAITNCGPLVKVQGQEINLVHQSARDYLLRTERDSDAVLEAFQITVDSSHLELTQKCLDCIAQSSLQQRVVSIDAKLDCQEPPLLRYATLHWPKYAKSYLALNAKLLYTLQQFLWTNHTMRRHWWVAYRKEKLFTLPQTILLLYMLCYLGLVPLVQTEVAWESLKPRFMKRIRRKDSNRNTALHVAIRAPDRMVVQVLINNGPEVDARDKYNKTALHRAAEEGYEEIVRLLLSKGADVNADANDGKTVLYCALSARGNNAVVRVLLDKGANINAKDRFGGTTLHLATWETNVEIVQLLVDSGTDINAIDSFGRTVLHSAVGPWRASEAVVQTLVNKGVDVSTRESNGSTVLHWAAEAGNKAVVQLLVDRGAAVNAKDNYGQTALH